MKNIHLIPTDKPSRLQLNVNTKRLILFNNIQSNNESAHLTTQNIYITSDEEIKEDEYYLGQDNNIYCLVTTVNFNGKKIILTTDQDLIKDGVQAIDDEFLNWFVQNPSCEEIGVLTNNMKNADYIEVAERLYKYINPTSKMDCPNSVYITTEKWYYEWLNIETDLDLFDWCVKFKNK